MKIMTVFVLFIFTFLAFGSSWTPLLAQQKEPPKLTLGVIPLKATGVKDYEALSLSNRLHSELVNTKQFRVVETERINEVLHEIGFQQYGFCTDEECAAKVGSVLGAQWMVTGAVGRIGETYLVDVRMIDVNTRQVFLTASRDFVGQIDGLLQYMENIAKELAAKTEHRLKYGSLEITSQPPSVFVFIDGELKGQTPFDLKEIFIGDHAIELKKAGYLTWEEAIVIEPLKQKKVDAILKKLCTIKVTSIPLYAKIYINGKYVANTPWNDLLPEGAYKLLVSKPNYLSEERTINLTQDDQLVFELKSLAEQERIAKLRQDRLKDQKSKAKKSSKKWLWGIGSAVVVGGGVAAFLILRSGEEGGRTDVIGTPPEPPGKP